MEFPKFTDDLSIISKLGDNPGMDNGLSAEELKAKFDEASLLLQAYLNGTLVELLNTAFAGGDSLPVDGLNMNGAINMNRNPLQNVRDPESDHEGMNLGYAKAHFVPVERTVNGKALGTDIALNADDVGARSETWLPTIAEIGAASAENLNGLYMVNKDVVANGSKRYVINGQMIMYGRVNSGGISSNAVYVLCGYNAYRAPVVTELSKGTSITVSTGGDNTNGWYVEIANAASNGNIKLTFIGAGIPVSV